MAYILGIDTGGTYTDAVIIENTTKEIISKAKARTTKYDLKIGIETVIDKLNISDRGLIKMVCLSTTLATNAVVEKRGYKTALISIGKAPAVNTPAQYAYTVSGKISIKGCETEPLVEAEIRKTAAELKSKVDAVAVSGYASVRNPSQEIRVRDIVKAETGLPVFCAHELSGNLGFEERTNTAILNAGLIGIVSEFIDATKAALCCKGISGRMMIVKSDGSLMGEKLAAERPIETVLSGPAASITGAVALSGTADAILLDMGGTTVDIADYDNNRIKISCRGARASEWRTSVRAVAVSTFGIGGDSWIQADRGMIKAGPVKAEPVSRISCEYKEYLRELKIIDEMPISSEKKMNYSRGCIYTGKEDNISGRPHTYMYFEENNIPVPEDMRIVDITPTDLLCIKGIYTSGLDEKAARIRLKIIADYMGIEIDELVCMMTEEVEKTVFLACLQSFADFSGQNTELGAEPAAVYLADKMFSEKNSSFLEVEGQLKKPVVAVGAPVRAWLPHIAERLHTDIIIPENSEVANAVGAALGYIYEKSEALVRKEKSKDEYSLFLPCAKRQFAAKEEALETGLKELEEDVRSKAVRAGCSNPEITIDYEDIYVDAFGSSESVYVETRITAEATGNPDI